MEKQGKDIRCDLKHRQSISCLHVTDYKHESKYPKMRGFTLIETVIGMALFSLILLLGFNSLFLVSKSVEISKKTISDSDSYIVANNFLLKNIQNALPILTSDENSRSINFKGNRNKLSFVGHLPTHYSRGGLYNLTLKLQKSTINENNDLILQYKSVISYGDITPDALTKQDIESEILAHNIKDIQISYYGASNKEANREWKNAWNQNGSFEMLPEVIKISLIKDDNQAWPDLNISLKNQYANGLYQLVQYQ